MYDRILKQMRGKIRTRQYVMTIHAEEEMTDDSLSIFDVERVVLTGSIVERQRDQETAEWKYLVEGETVAGNLSVVVAKISITGKLVIITVYAE
jgi:arginyl-tRNA--protein-N-Asp/Glu arginylyltransferase